MAGLRQMAAQGGMSKTTAGAIRNANKLYKTSANYRAGAKDARKAGKTSGMSQHKAGLAAMNKSNRVAASVAHVSAAQAVSRGLYKTNATYRSATTKAQYSSVGRKGMMAVHKAGLAALGGKDTKDLAALGGKAASASPSEAA